ncbi:threonine synthase [Desulfurivibrio dismutans]|uniref:threonine synthase n=1 Tax=Desulfurivibrio dismutans TaxID=1398908 RepID=UPI0023DC17C4|nr:threonine synthase [Desulfurivibrio alkaliphilus]MDF1614928.1 threonine synthase [Desulfurivibrio alkaliphilus]
MRYISTRGGITPIPFSEAVMMGLANDGGLLLPEKLPPATSDEIAAWRQLDYPDLAVAVLSRFIDDIPHVDLERLVKKSYAGFQHPEVTPIVKHGECHILELFHGPTLAFKDVALQLLGNIFEYLLAKSGGRMNIIGATSGDTGSAAIYGVRGKERINIFILHPQGRVSPIQERQMTTVLDDNVYNIAVQGTFDDGQAIVKKLFGDLTFKEKHQLGAINSINWARIVAQVVYYVYAALKLTGEGRPGQVDFAVPTGNFGDIFAGFVARRLIPEQIGQLILATNENNLLTRFVQAGDYSVSSVRPTSSPSMDIQVASNFERYLYYLNDQDARRTSRDMEQFAATGSLQFDPARLARIQQDFVSRSADEPATKATIRDFHQAHDYLLDPHTAVGVYAGLACRRADIPLVCLATAHPAKFGEAVEAAIGRPPELPPALAALENLESRCRVLPAEELVIKDFVAQHAL